MGYDQYAVPDTAAVKSYVVAFLEHSQTHDYGLRVLARDSKSVKKKR